MQKPVVKIFQMNQHRIYNNIYLNQRRMLPVCFLFCLQFAIKHIDHQRFISILFHVIKMRCDVIYCCLIFRRNVSKFARERHCVRLNVANLFGCQVFFFWSFAPFFCVLFCFNGSLNDIDQLIYRIFSPLFAHSYLRWWFFRMQIMDITHVTYMPSNIHVILISHKITANEIIEIEFESRCAISTFKTNISKKGNTHLNLRTQCCGQIFKIKYLYDQLFSFFFI